MTDETSLRTPQQIADAVECAIGLNVDCGGTEGVHRVRDAVLAAIQPALARLGEYENTINWMTTCTSCARVLDSSIRETERAEHAEAAIARVRSLADRWDNALGIDKTYARTLRAALDEPGLAATQPREHCGALSPQTLLTTPRTECVLRPGHSGSHADQVGCRWWYDPSLTPKEEPGPA